MRGSLLRFWTKRPRKHQQQEAELLRQVAASTEAMHAEWFELLTQLHQRLILSPKRESLEFLEQALVQRRFRPDTLPQTSTQMPTQMLTQIPSQPPTRELSAPEAFFQWQKWLCHSSGIALLLQVPPSWDWSSATSTDWGSHWAKLGALFEDIRQSGCANVVLTISAESKRTRLQFAYGTNTTTYEL